MNISNGGLLAIAKFLNDHPNVVVDALQIGSVSFKVSF